MKKAMLVVGILLASGSTYGAGVHWDYIGAKGPANWANLSAKYRGCSGKNQSPVDLSHFIKADLEPIGFHYEAGGNAVLNNGHTIQVSYAPGSTIELDGHTFELKQFHFHAPSENHINGKSYPMEAHLVHADQDGNLAVVAVMFEEGKENQALSPAWAKMPKKAGGKKALPELVSAEGLLPADRGYYRFNGSLTTPPCTEGVWWLVMKQPVSASKDQLKRFAHLMHHPNNRPIQALNARPELE
jgi:carbonic anhydrase